MSCPAGRLDLLAPQPQFDSPALGLAVKLEAQRAIQGEAVDLAQICGFGRFQTAEKGWSHRLHHVGGIVGVRVPYRLIVACGLLEGRMSGKKKLRRSLVGEHNTEEYAASELDTSVQSDRHYMCQCMTYATMCIVLILCV